MTNASKRTASAVLSPAQCPASEHGATIATNPPSGRLVLVKVDALFRPNQIFAIGGLSISLITGERAEAILEAVTQRLWTPLGLRSLAPGEPGYALRYEGGVRDRDSVYHQGTVWPWLLGPFVEAGVRVRSV